MNPLEAIAGSNPLWWGIFGLLIISIIVMRQRRRDRELMQGYTRTSLREQREERSVREGGLDSRSIAAEAADKMLVSFHEISRELIARLDTKARTVEQILEDADHKLRELERAKKELEELLARAGNAGPEASAASAAAAPGVPAPVSQPAAPQAAPQETQADPVEARIYGLADRGRSVEEIEQETGVPRGEVKLILNMRGAPKADWSPALPEPEPADADANEAPDREGDSAGQAHDDPEVSHQEMNDILGRRGKPALPPSKPTHAPKT